MKRHNTIEKLIEGIIDQGIVEAIGDAVSIQDTNYKILYLNKKAMEIIGNQVGKHCYKTIENKDAVCESCPLELSFKDGTVHTVERRNPVARPPLIVEITTSAIKDRTGKIIAGIEVVRNITGRKKMEEERDKLLIDLAKTFTNAKTLSGLLPICASCKKIRDDKGYWSQVEDYIRRHTEADFTHGYCPDCVEKYFPRLSKKKQ